MARPTSDGFRVVDAFSRIIRLGEGIAASRRISEAAITRAVEALQICRDKMQARGVMRARLIATEACRAAENGEEFRSRVAKEAGLELEIINSATEARLAATGCTELFDPAASGVILFDIGGGSSELVRLNRSGHGSGLAVAVRRRPISSAGRRCRSASLRLPSAMAAKSCRATSMTPWSMRSRALSTNFATAHRSGLDSFHMLGTSGTVTTIAGVYLRLRRYDRRRVDGCWLSDVEISGVVDELMAMSFDERAANPCIGAERADLVLAGCAILDAIRRAFPCPRLRVADRGLREGMLVEMMREDGVWGEA